MDQIRKILARIRLVKTGIVNWYQILLEKSKNPYWMVDILLMLAGIRFKHRNRWQLIGWRCYQFGTYLQWLIALTGMISACILKVDVLMVIWSTLVLTILTLCLVKQHLISRHLGGIEELRNHLIAPSFCSGDLTFDKTTRVRFRRLSQQLSLGMILFAVVQQIICCLPHPELTRMFYISPYIGLFLGETIAEAAQVFYYGTSTVLWIPKMFGCPIITIITMHGLEAESKILANNFGRIEENLKNLNGRYWDSEERMGQYWDQLNKLVKSSLNQQTMLLSYLPNLQSMFEYIFFCSYYTALVAIGAIIYIVQSEPRSVVCMGMASSVVLYALECYSLCYRVDTLKHLFESITGHMFSLCAKLPYSADFHAEYVEARSTLTIIAISSRNVISFGCAGVSDISVGVFTKMVHTCYTVLTFLMDVVRT